MRVRRINDACVWNTPPAVCRIRYMRVRRLNDAWRTETSDDASWPRRRQCAVYAIYACGELMTHGGTAVYRIRYIRVPGINDACGGSTTASSPGQGPGKAQRQRPSGPDRRARSSDQATPRPGFGVEPGAPERATQAGAWTQGGPRGPREHPAQIKKAQSERTRAKQRPCDQT